MGATIKSDMRAMFIDWSKFILALVIIAISAATTFALVSARSTENEKEIIHLGTKVDKLSERLVKDELETARLNAETTRQLSVNSVILDNVMKQLDKINGTN